MTNDWLPFATFSLEPHTLSRGMQKNLSLPHNVRHWNSTRQSLWCGLYPSSGRISPQCPSEQDRRKLCGRAPGLVMSVSTCVCAKSLQSCPTLCNPTDCSPLGSSVHGILQARILEGLPCPPPGDLPDPGMETKSLCLAALAGSFFTTAYKNRLRWQEWGRPPTCALSLNFQGCCHFPDGEDGTERLSCAPEVTQLLNVRIGTWAQIL